MSRNSLFEAGAKYQGEVNATGLEPRTTQFLNEHSTIWQNWPILANTKPYFGNHSTLNWPILASLAKWLSVRLRTKWFWVRVQF